jgi:glutathione S-transferase
MIRFYFHPTPNPAKVALFLEEAGLAYEAIPIDTSKGEQHTPAFRIINPNGKVPAIVDTEGPRQPSSSTSPRRPDTSRAPQPTDRNCSPG